MNFKKSRGDAPDEFPSRILASVACKKKREDQTRRSILDLRIPDAKCIAVDGGIFENVF